MPRKQGKGSELTGQELTNLVRRYARRMRSTSSTFEHPEPGWTAEEEFTKPAPEEMQWLFDNAWSKDRWRYRADGSQISKNRASERHSGNHLRCGIYLTHGSEMIFDQREILSPLSCALTRAHWRTLISAGLIKRHVNWVWLPAAMRAYPEYKWSFGGIYGWSITHQNIKSIRDLEKSAFVITPDGCFSERDYWKAQASKWKSTSIYADIIALISQK
jgi:hypothetical protein